MQKSIFYDLSLNTRAEYVWLYGSYVISRSFYNYTISLYAINGFFVEVWYLPNNNELRKVEIVEDEKILDLYLDNIDITEMIS